MTTAIIRFSLGAPLVVIALTVFAAALLIEWLRDLARTCPHSESHK